LISREQRIRDPQARPLVSGLLEGLAYDSEHNLTAVNRKQIEQWGVGLDEAFAAAKDHLGEKTDPNRLEGRAASTGGSGAIRMTSSRMLLRE
jgi:hypothetical protein